MNTKPINEAEIAELKVSALPTRPTAPGQFGGKGFTASDMKKAFDRLPLYIIERLNSLISDVSREGEGSLVAEIPTSIEEAPRLAQLLSGIKSGELSAFLSLGDETLGERMQRLAEWEAEVMGTLSVLVAHLSDRIADASHPEFRNAENGEVRV